MPKTFIEIPYVENNDDKSFHVHVSFSFLLDSHPWSAGSAKRPEFHRKIRLFCYIPHYKPPR